MDLTTQLAQMRHNALRLESLLSAQRLVVCLGSRAMLFFASAVIRHPERVLAAVSTEAEGLDRVAALRPDLLIVSDRLEEGCGIQLAISVRQRFPNCRTLLLVQEEHRIWKLRDAMEAGCEGILLDSEFGQGRELLALQSVCSGGMYRKGDLTARGSGRLPLSLTERERQVLRLLVQGGGRSNGAIARELILSEETVRTHVRSLLAKLNARHRLHAALRAVHLGLVDYQDVPGDR